MTQDLAPVQTIFSGHHAQWWSELYSGPARTPEEHFFRQRRDFVLDLVAREVPRSSRLLDLGCGTGPVLASLRAGGWRCTGVDGAPDMLRGARERLVDAGLDASDLHEADCRATPFPDASFDAVLCLGVISYVDDYAPVLREIRRLLVPGGLAVITCRNAANPVWSDPVLAARAVARRLLRPGGTPAFTPGRFLDRASVRRAIESAGLAVQREVGIGFGPFRFAKRRLIGDRASIRLSDTIGAVAGRLGMWPLARRITDISMWIVRAPLQGAGA